MPDKSHITQYSLKLHSIDEEEADTDYANVYRYHVYTCYRISD